MNTYPIFVRAFPVVFLTLAGCTLDFAKLAPDEQHPPPVVASIQPTSTFAGDSITIAGTNLSPDLGTTTVKFAGGPVGTLISTSETSLVVEVPQNAGTGAITVATEFGTATSATFTYLGPGEPPTNTLAGAIVFQAQPTHALVTGEGGILATASNPLGNGTTDGTLVLRALNGEPNPVFAEGASISMTATSKQYQHVFPMLGSDVVALEPGVGAVEYQPPSGSVALDNEWKASGRLASFTDASDLNWTTLTAASLDSNRVLVVLMAQEAMGWSGQARVVDFMGPANLAPLQTVMNPNSQTSTATVPSLTISQDGTLAVLVSADGHGVSFEVAGIGTGVDISGTVVSAAPLVVSGTKNSIVVGRTNGSLDLVDPATGAVTTASWLGSGPVANQMFAAPGLVAMMSNGLPSVSVVGADGAPESIPLAFTPCAAVLGSTTPPSCGMASSPDGTAVLWDSSSTSVTKVSLTYREVEWTTAIPFVASNVAALWDGIVMNYGAPVPYFVGLATDNLTTPIVPQKAPLDPGIVLVADPSRAQVWAITPLSAIRESVVLAGTPAMTQVGATFTPPVGQAIATVLPAADDAYIILQDNSSTYVANSSGSTQVTLTGTGAVLGAADFTSSMIYLIVGSTLYAVNMETNQQTSVIDLTTVASLSTPQTLDFLPSKGTAVVTDGSQVAFFEATNLDPTSSLAVATSGCAHSPDQHFLYCVLPGAHGMAASLARVSMETQALEVLFALPTPGPTLAYSFATPPPVTYLLSFAPGGANLYIDNLLSGDILHVD